MFFSVCHLVRNCHKSEPLFSASLSGTVVNLSTFSLSLSQEANFNNFRSFFFVYLTVRFFKNRRSVFSVCQSARIFQKSELCLIQSRIVKISSSFSLSVSETANFKDLSFFSVCQSIRIFKNHVFSSLC